MDYVKYSALRSVVGGMFCGSWDMVSVALVISCCLEAEQ